MAESDSAPESRKNSLSLMRKNDSNSSSSQSLSSGGKSPYLSSPSTRRKLLKHMTDQEKEEFRLENGSETDSSVDREALMASVLLENPELETRWYFRYFLGNLHINFAAFLRNSRGRELVLLSVLVPEHGPSDVKAILWRATGSEHLIVNSSQAYRPKSNELDYKKILLAFGRGELDRNLYEISGAEVQQQLLVLEEQEGAVNFKFGILYAKPGQETDDEMFSNERGSRHFDEFCRILGDKVSLDGFNGYRGGLDIKNGSTGEESIHTVEFGKEIMFHVSTLLPYGQDHQQIARKRHLGNDICNIVYVDSDDEFDFNPEKIKSRFNHIFLIVTRNSKAEFSIKVFTKMSVPEYGPSLPNPPTFTDPVELRRFILVKLMNGEKSALGAPSASFADKRQRTLNALIQDIYESERKGKLGRNSNKRMSRSFRQGSSKDINEFRVYGQSLKVEKYASGVAPTSTHGTNITETSALKEPWLPICLTSSFAHEIRCGDQWSDNVLIAAPTGLFLLPMMPHEAGSLKPQVLIDDSFSVYQIAVDERTNFVILRGGRNDDEAGKKTHVYVVPLDLFVNIEAPLNRKTMRQYILKSSKPCSHFSYRSDLHLKCSLVLITGKKIMTFEMSEPTTGIQTRFQHVKDFHFSENIDVVTIVQGPPSVGQSGAVLVGCSNGDYDLVDMASFSTTNVLRANPHRTLTHSFQCQELMGVTQEDHELMIGYSRHTIFCDYEAQDTREFNIAWPSQPHGFAYVQPYVLGFAHDAIYIVTLKNGNLIKTLTLPLIKLLSFRTDIIFCTRHPDGISIYRIPRDNLSGKAPPSPELSRLPHQRQGQAMVRKFSYSTPDVVGNGPLDNIVPMITTHEEPEP